MPVSSAKASVSVPTTVPGRIGLPSTSALSPVASSKSLFQSPVRGFMICEVEPMVYSHTLLPVSMYASASGVKRNSLACK